MENILLVCSAIITICSAITAVVAVGKLVKAPKDTLDGRLSDIERKLAKHDELLSNDKSKIDSIEEGNRVTQKALLALLAHGIDGNNISALEEAKNDLQKYLINR